MLGLTDYLEAYQCVFADDPKRSEPVAMFKRGTDAKNFRLELYNPDWPILTVEEWWAQYEDKEDGAMASGGREGA